MNSGVTLWSLVTGASSGIGRSLARQLAARGYNVVLTGRDRAELEGCAAEIRAASGVQTLVIACDLAKPSAWKIICDQVREAQVEIDLLVNNAGFGLHGVYEETSIDESVALVQVQLMTLLRLTHWFLPRMKQAGRGHILNVASLYSHCPVPYQAVYSACKAFMLTFSRALEAELRASGVGLSVVCPGVTRTRFRERMGRSESTRVKGMTADKVASVALSGLFAGYFMIVPGRRNLAFSLVARVSPASWMVRFIARINRVRGLGSHQNEPRLVDKFGEG